MGRKEKARDDGGVSSPEERWLAAVERLNQQAGEVRYELVRCAVDGYWYIAPKTTAKEVSLEQLAREPQGEPAFRMRDARFRRWRRRGSFLLDSELERCGSPTGEYMGRFSYHPFSGEFLPDVLASHHHETIRQLGSHPFNEYQRGIYVQPARVVLLRPYWNPLDAEGRFDPYQDFDHEVNDVVTNTTIRMLIAQGLPSAVRVLRDVENQLVRELTGPYV